MFKFVAFAVFLAAFSHADAFFTCCANQPNAVCPTRIVSPSCSGDRCTVTRGQTLSANAFFVPNRAHSELRVGVTATVGGITINIPTQMEDACSELFIGGNRHGCPTTPGVEHEWRIVDPVPTTIPAMNNAVIRYALREHGVVEGCVDIRANII